MIHCQILRKFKNKIDTETVFDEMRYMVKYFIVNIFSFNNSVLLGKPQYNNNIYTSCLHSTEPYIKPIFLHHFNMHANTVLCGIINLLSLNFPNDQ